MVYELLIERGLKIESETMTTQTESCKPNFRLETVEIRHTGTRLVIRQITRSHFTLITIMTGESQHASNFPVTSISSIVTPFV